jgi:hypothetical protein
VAGAGEEVRVIWKDKMGIEFQLFRDLGGGRKLVGCFYRRFILVIEELEIVCVWETYPDAFVLAVS